MEPNTSLEQALTEITRLRAQIAALESERRGVADANVRAAMKLVELSEQRRVEYEEREQRLQTALRAAETASQQKDAFMAKVSHELRTPLNGVIGMTTLLLDSPLTAAQKECAESSLASARNLLELIQDILDFSKLAAAEIALESREFDLWRLCEEVVRALSPRAHARDLAIGVAIAPSTPRRILGDAARLRQVLANLLANAVKFTDEGEVLLRVRALDADERFANLRIEVIDTGCGIPRAEQHRLFRAFSQVDDSLRRRHDGTGLGLAISQGIVAMMGGDIQVDSEVGIGSRFHFDWRAEIREEAADAARAGERVALVVGASSMTERTLDAHLEHAGARIVKLANLDSLEIALAASASNPDWVLIEAGGGSQGARSADFDARCTAVAARSPLALLEPLDSGATLAAPGVTTLKLPLCPTHVTAWLQGQPLPSHDASSIAEARATLVDDTRGAELRVLLVEDNRVNQRVAKSMLRRLGCQVDLASDGEEAVAMQAKGDYDVVLMDCQMPVVDGLTATRRIRENEAREPRSRRTPIIALTAQAMSGDRERCIETGMDDYLSKPIDPLELARALRRWSTTTPAGAEVSFAANESKHSPEERS